MKPLALQLNDINEKHLEIFQEVCTIVEQLQDGLSCHQVCGIIIQRLYYRKIEWLKGTFAGADHSWLRIENTEVIIDPYPWATGSGPIILTTCGILNPWRKIYAGDVWTLEQQSRLDGGRLASLSG